MSAGNAGKSPDATTEREVADALSDAATRRRLARALARAIRRIDDEAADKRGWRGGAR
ncbi:MAG: hypothetical protein RL071_3935 [Pseudomonadota bacterium]|jgi:hypothetical protein